MNNITTQGYFIKRLRDCGFVVIKLFHNYNIADPRKWTLLINPGRESLVLTCYCNKTDLREVMFEFNDGGTKIPKNYFLSTESMEVVISFLINNGISNHIDKNDPYFKNYENSNPRQRFHR